MNHTILATWFLITSQTQDKPSVVFLQVPFSPSHAVPHKLLAIHAIIWLHIQHYGQVIWWVVWEISEGNRGNTWTCSPDAYDKLAICLSPKDWNCLRSISTIRQFYVGVDVMAFGMAVNGACLGLRVLCICGWENQTKEDENANMGNTKIQLPGNRLLLVVWLCLYMMVCKLLTVFFITVWPELGERVNQRLNWKGNIGCWWKRC